MHSAVRRITCELLLLLLPLLPLSILLDFWAILLLLVK
jgi:hypothetical protein